MAQKRGLEDLAHSSRKKRKAESNVSKIKEGSQLGANHVSLDQLRWKSVSLPDRFEDAEGFFGLEEVDDVDVTKDTINGKVRYRVGKRILEI